MQTDKLPVLTGSRSQRSHGDASATGEHAGASSTFGLDPAQLKDEFAGLGRTL